MHFTVSFLCGAAVGFIVGMCTAYVMERRKIREALLETQAVLAGVADVLSDVVEVLERLLVNNKKNG